MRCLLTGFPMAPTAWVHADEAEFISPVRRALGHGATPTIHAGRMYTLGATGILNCLEGSTGEVVWKVDILADNSAENISHGVCSSPLIVDNRVVVSPTGSNGISLAAYELRLWKARLARRRESGELRFTAAGRTRRRSTNPAPQCGTASPVTMLASGKNAVEVPWTNSERTNCSQPLANVDSQVKFFVGTGLRHRLRDVANRRRGKAAKGTMAQSLMKTKFTSPIYLNGYIYGLDDGILESMDAKTGEKRKKAGRYGHGQILLAGDVFLVQAEGGEVVLVYATPQLQELGDALPAVSGKTWKQPGSGSKVSACPQRPRSGVSRARIGVRVIPTRFFQRVQRFQSTSIFAR